MTDEEKKELKALRAMWEKFKESCEEVYSAFNGDTGRSNPFCSITTEPCTFDNCPIVAEARKELEKCM